MDLYLDDTLHFEKLGAEVTLPDDPNTWAQEVLQELYKQIPYVSDFEPTVTMESVDAERGYGMGHFVIESRSDIPVDSSPGHRAAMGVRRVRIPIIIKNKKLQPFDVMVTDGAKALPITQARLRQALFRPQLFDITSTTPGDQSMLEQLYPPFRQRPGMGRGITDLAEGSKTASDAALTDEEFTQKLMGILGEKSNLKQKLVSSTNPKPLVTLGDQQPKKLAQVNLKFLQKMATVGKGNSRPVSDAALRLKVKDITPSQGKGAKKEVESIKEGSLLTAILPSINAEDYATLKKELSNEKVAAAFYNNPATRMALEKLSGVNPTTPEGRLVKIAQHGIPRQVIQVRREDNGYLVKSASVHAWAPDSLKVSSRGEMVKTFGEKVVLAADVTGSVTMSEGDLVSDNSTSEVEARSRPISMYGLYKVRTTLGKELVGFVIPNLLDGDCKPVPLALFTNGSHTSLQGEIAGEAAGAGANLPEGKPHGYGTFYRVLPDGTVEAFVPMKVLGTIAGDTDKYYAVELFSGEQLQVAMQPGLKKPVGIERKILLPQEMKWLPLEDAEKVDLIETKESFDKTSAPNRHLASVVARAGGMDSFSFSGVPLQKLASEDTQHLSFDDSLFLLAGLGVDTEYGSKKLAEAVSNNKPVQIRIGRMIKTADESVLEARKLASIRMNKFPGLKVNLIKEAAVIPDPNAVDTVLSLGFISPENIRTFVEYLPQLDDTQSKLCELLIATRLGGLNDIPLGALERSVKTVEQVIEGLKVLAFAE